jgi:hypothetical protein
MPVSHAEAIEEIEISPPQHDATPPIEIIWDDDKIEKVGIVHCLDWKTTVEKTQPLFLTVHCV